MVFTGTSALPMKRSLLKTFGKGVLYVLGLPFFILALVLFAVIGLIAFLFQVLKSIVFFFTGQKFFPELPEDKEYRLMMQKKMDTNNAEPTTPEVKEEEILSPLKEEPEPVKETTVEEQPVFSTVEEACFKETVQEAPVVEEKAEVNDLSNLLDTNKEEIPQEPVIEEAKEEKQTVLETAEPKPEDEDDLVEVLETYVPRSSSYAAADDDEGDTGVDIDYDYKG